MKDYRFLVVGTAMAKCKEAIELTNRMDIELITTPTLDYKPKEFPIINIPEMDYYSTDILPKRSKHQCTRLKVRAKKQKKTHRKKKRK